MQLDYQIQLMIKIIMQQYQIKLSLIVTTYASLRSTIRRTTVTSLTSTISLTGSSNMIENNLNGQQLIHSTNRNNNNGINSTIEMNTIYPLILALPKDMLDENLKKVARLSAIVWRYPRAKSLLLSGSSFCNKCCINLVVKEPQPSSSSSSNTNNCSSYLVVSYICFPSNVIDCFSPAHQLSKTYVHISCCD
ncbi:unnamed protein product [Rotaria magnacalcarata]